MAVNMTEMLLGPGAEPPPGVVPNFVNPYSLNSWMIGLGIACAAFTSVIVGLRIYIKIFIIKQSYWEDWFCVLGWLTYLAYIGVSMVIAWHGGGTHQWNVQLFDLLELNYWANLSEILYGPCIVFVKVSILLQYLRLFVTTPKSTLLYVIHLILWITVTFYVADTIAELCACVPRKKLWEPWVSGTCINGNAALIATASANVFTDLAIFALPMKVIYHLKIPRKKKIGIAIIFAFGALACITSITRLVLSVQLLSTPDISYHMIAAGLFTYAEIALGLVASCLPVFPRLFKVTSSRTGANTFTRSRLYPFSQTSSNKNTNPSRGSRAWHGHADPYLLEKKKYRPLPDDQLMQLSEVVVERGGSVPTTSSWDKQTELDSPDDWIRPINRIETQPLESAEDWIKPITRIETQSHTVVD